MTAPYHPRTVPPLLVGREREQAALRAHLDAALAGHGSLVLIGGEAGIGKTTVAAAVCREAAERGALVLVGRCYDLTETPPYGPWLALLARYRADDNGPPLPATVDQPGTVGMVTSQVTLFQQIEAFLQALARRRPLVLFLDDLHWADLASLELLRFIARTLADYPLLVLALYRVDELTPHHPLFTRLPLLVHDSAANRLDLRPLSAAAIHSLVAARYRLPEADEIRLVSYLQARAEGNALFVSELLRALEEQEALRHDDDGWVFGDASQVQVPLLLKQVIGGRVARLGERAQELLGIAAVAGQDVPLALWAAIGEVDEEALSAVIKRAAEAHIVGETPDGLHARFAHPLIRATLYEDILPSRRRRLHRQVAEALERLPAPDFDALAYHYYQAGDDRAARWLVVAGVRAQYAGALLTASQRFAAALRLLEARGGHVVERGWLLFCMARMEGASDPQRGVSYLDAAVRVMAAVEDPALMAWMTRYRGTFWCRLGQVRAGIAEIMRGEELGRGIQAGERPWLQGFAAPPTVAGDVTFHVLPALGGGAMVTHLALAGQVAEACRRGEAIVSAEAVRAAERSRVNVPLADVANALWGLGLAYATLGRPAEARVAMHEARARGTELSNQWSIYMSFAGELRLVHVPYETERVVERQRMIAAAEQAWALAGDVRRDLPHAIVRYPVFPVDGEWPLIRDVVGTVPRLGERTYVGQFAYWQGDSDVARMMVAELLPDGPVTEPGDCLFVNAIELQRVAVALALDAGDLATAREWLEAHDRWLAWSGAVRGLPEGQLAWAAYCRAAGDAAQARAHAERALVHASEPRQPLSLIAAHRLLGELHTGAGSFDDAATHLDAALHLADACAAPYERALTLLARAELLAATGDSIGAKTLLDAARGLLMPLGAKPALARADALAARLHILPELPAPYPDDLTPREVDVMRLIATGRSNQEMAETLSISVRTVNRHIENLYRKIGAHGKADATAYAFRHQLT